MTVKSLCIPEDIEYVARSEKIEKSQSLLKLARIGFECYAARSYGHASSLFGKLQDF